MTKNNLKPALRFKGFTEAWEQRKAKELFFSTADKGYPDLPVLSATQDKGMIKREETGINIHHNKKNETGYKRVCPGQFVIHLRSFQGGFAHSAIEGITSPAYTVFAFNDCTMHDDIYWKNIFASNEFIKRLDTVTYGIRDGRSINYNDFLNMSFIYPSIEEQKEISSFLTALDNLITLHQRKYDSLVNIKKSLLQKMFPQKNQNTPEIRFKGFTEAWEQRKLSDLAKATGGTSIESEFIEGGKYKVISIGSYGEDSKYRDQGIRANKTSKTQERILSKGDLTMILNDKTASGNIIGRVLLIDQDDMYVYNQRTQRLEIDKVIYDPQFIYHYLNADSIRNKIIKASQGNTQIYVNYSNICKFEYFLPIRKDEQIKLGEFFEKLDNLITLHQRKLEKLKNVKKACLKKMFV
jgi:type I restriction enzyme S subunit